MTDRNGPWVSERLGELGCEVAHIVCVGDRPEDLRDALEFLRSAEVDLLITTGGLGPTADDLTAEIVAAFADREMVLDEAMEKRISEIVAGFARRMKFDPEGLRDGTRKQAMVPEGSISLDPAGAEPRRDLSSEPKRQSWSSCQGRRASSRRCGPPRSPPSPWRRSSVAPTATRSRR